MPSSNALQVAIVFLAVMVDGLILSAVAAVFPGYFYLQHEENQQQQTTYNNTTSTINVQEECDTSEDRKFLQFQNIYLGVFYASRKVVQFLTSFAAGPIIDRVGPDIPMFCGIVILTVNNIILALGESYVLLLAVYAVGGFGAAFVQCAAFPLIVELFDDEKERSRALGFTLVFADGVGLVLGLALGSSLYEFVDKSCVFYVICGVTALLFILQFLARPLKIRQMERSTSSFGSILKDPYIWLTASVHFMGHIMIPIVQTGMPTWMMNTMCAKKWMFGVAFIPLPIGYLMTAFIISLCGQHDSIPRWVGCVIGIVVIALSTLSFSFVTTFYWILPPAFISGVALAFKSCNAFSIMSHLVTTRHVSAYGSAHAINQAASNAAFVIGPLAAGPILNVVGFQCLMQIMAGILLIYAPIIYFLRAPTLMNVETTPLLLQLEKKNRDQDGRRHLDDETNLQGSP